MLLAGSSKSSEHGKHRKKWGRPSCSSDVESVLSQMGDMLDSVITKLGDQQAEQASAEAAERDKDHALFMDTIRLLLSKR